MDLRTFTFKVLRAICTARSGPLYLYLVTNHIIYKSLSFKFSDVECMAFYVIKTKKKKEKTYCKRKTLIINFTFHTFCTTARLGKTVCIYRRRNNLANITLEGFIQCQQLVFCRKYPSKDEKNINSY